MLFVAFPLFGFSYFAFVAWHANKRDVSKKRDDVTHLLTISPFLLAVVMAMMMCVASTAVLCWTAAVLDCATTSHTFWTATKK